MVTLSQVNLTLIPVSDVELASIDWRPDMSLSLSLFFPDKRSGRLVATFARHLKMSLDYDERSGGRPMTFDTRFSELGEGSGWRVLFDFAGAGSIAFDCSDLLFEYTPVAPTKTVESTGTSTAR